MNREATGSAKLGNIEETQRFCAGSSNGAFILELDWTFVLVGMGAITDSVGRVIGM